MLNKIIDKRNYLIYTIIIILFLLIVTHNMFSIKTTTKTNNYFDEKIAIELYTNKNTKTIYKQIDQILKRYDKLYRNSNKNDNEELIKILKYGKSLYKKTDGYIDITTLELLKNIKKEEDYEFKTTIDKINFKDKSTLTNINISNIIGPYAIKKIEEYLKQNKIESYIIKEDSNLVIGKPYNKKNYNIPIIKDEQIIDILSIKNKSIAIKGDVNTFKPYMVNPITSTKNKENKLVVVIGNNINKVNYIANVIYLMPNDKIENYVKKYKVEAMWYDNDLPVKTKEFKKYELKK